MQISDPGEDTIVQMLLDTNPHVQEQGWNLVLWRYGVPLRKYIIAVLASHQLPTDAWEDIAQKTYLIAIENLADKKYRNQPLLPWLCRIAKNHIGNYYRREKARNRRTVELDLEQTSDSLQVVILPQSNSPEDILAQQSQEAQQQVIFRQAFSRLDRDEQDLINAYINHPEMSVDQIAQLLGKNPKTVRNKKSKALKRLREFIADASRKEGLNA
jgi:RNA polymerase sigma factor (sigma-70 family)